MIVLQKKITNENNAFDIEKNMLKYIFNDVIERLELSANVDLSLLISYKNTNLYMSQNMNQNELDSLLQPI